MKRSTYGVVLVSALLVAGTAVAQMPRSQAGAAYGRGAGAGANVRANANGAPGNAAQAQRGGRGLRGTGGWWNWANPQNAEQKALMDQVSGLNARVQTANRELNLLVRQNAPAAQQQAKRQEVATLQSQLQQLTNSNQRLLQQMGVPAGSGVCDGAGPSGVGRGQGRRGGQGMGRGMATGPRDGSGIGRGMATGPRDGSGIGRGMRLGPQDGSGPNPNCTLKTR